ncbi:MAG: hypothetical protein R3C44_03530 [Chloroflexota bacterium]
MNNAVFFACFETVRIKYLGEITENNSLFGTELLDHLFLLRPGAACLIACARYRRQLRINTGISRFGNKSFDMLYRR